MPIASVTGKLSNINQETLTFDIDVGQWIRFCGEKALIPFTGILPHSGRWNYNNRLFPTPNSPKYMSVVGFLTGIISEGGNKRPTAETSTVSFFRAARQIFSKSI